MGIAGKSRLTFTINRFALASSAERETIDLLSYFFASSGNISDGVRALRMAPVGL